MEVQCPEGVGPGELVSFQTPDGEWMEVAVPDGVMPGEHFTVEINAAPADPPPNEERVPEEEDERVPEWAEDDQENMPPGGAIVSAPPRHPAAQQQNNRAGKELVLALVQHATGILQGAMAPFLEAHCHMFEQDAEELRSGAGETHEQYAAFMAFVAELDTHFEGFVAERGFASSADCFAAIDAAVVADVAEQKREMAKLEQKLRAMQRRFMSRGGGGMSPWGEGTEEARDGTADSDSTSDDDDDNEVGQMLTLLGGDAEEGGEGGSSGRLPMMPLMMFAQPMSLEDLIEQALTLTQYETFSSIMRMKAKQLSMRRQWLASFDERKRVATDRLSELGGWSMSGEAEAGERLSQLWASLGTRILSLAPGHPHEGMLAMSAASQSGAEVELLHKFVAAGDAPPADANEKRELFHLLGAPLSRVAMLAPHASVDVMMALRGVQERIANANRVGEQAGSVSLIVDTLKVAHGLISVAERKMEQAMGEAEAKSAALRRAYTGA